ncbi:hypothetical protein AGMMS49940_22610 [Spirochaetia bacterium]|nr:hypothetical protein AGMMS49940_22610 [Spirochaetia bacterium]
MITVEQFSQANDVIFYQENLKFWESLEISDSPAKERNESIRQQSIAASHKHLLELTGNERGFM